MVKKQSYSVIKKALWEAWRAFLPAFLAVVYAQFAIGVDLREWRMWLLPLFIAAFWAGVKAVIKWVREEYGQKDYSNLLYKLPL